MGLFKLLSSVPPQPSPSPDPIGVRLAELEHQIRLLRLEWEETYDKVHRLLGKVSRRQAELARREDAPGSTNDEAGGVRPGVTPGELLRAARAQHGGRRGLLHG